MTDAEIGKYARDNLGKHVPAFLKCGDPDGASCDYKVSPHGEHDANNQRY